MIVSLIAALSSNRVIGIKNRLPWRLPADLKRFKKLTWGHHLVIGRKTFESIGRSLPGRRMVVLTRQRDYSRPGILTASSIEEALALAAGDEEVFVGGGEEVYQASLPLAQRLYLTQIHGRFTGDAHFPTFRLEDWRVVEEHQHEPTARNPLPYTFQMLERR